MVLIDGFIHISATTSDNVPSNMCAQRRFRSACAFAQADQNLHWAHLKYSRMQSSNLRLADKVDSDQTARMPRLILKSSLGARVILYISTRYVLFDWWFYYKYLTNTRVRNRITTRGRWHTRYRVVLAGWNTLIKIHLTLLLLNTTCPVLANNVDRDQLAFEEANWSGSSLFVIEYVTFHKKPGCLKLQVGVAS